MRHFWNFSQLLLSGVWICVAVPDGERRENLGASAAQLAGLPPCGSDTPAFGKYEKCMSSYRWKNLMHSEWTA